MGHERLVCADCGLHFRLDDFVEELGEMIACPACGSIEIEMDALDETAQPDAA